MPASFVDRVVLAGPEPKGIEKRMTRPAPGSR